MLIRERRIRVGVKRDVVCIAGICLMILELSVISHLIFATPFSLLVINGGKRMEIETIVSKILQYPAGWLWYFCERYHISLGNLAPHVFGLMLGCKKVKVKGEDND